MTEGQAGLAPPDSPSPDDPADALVDYFAANLETWFTADVLIRRAEAAGHSREAIEAAMARAKARLDTTTLDGLKARARRILWIVFGLGLLAVAAPVALAGSGLYGMQVPVIIGQAALVLVALALSRFAVDVRTGGVSGTDVTLLSLLVIPIVIFLVFPGSCIAYLFLYYSTLPAP
jgi:hypothetical protein